MGKISYKILIRLLRFSLEEIDYYLDSVAERPEPEKKVEPEPAPPDKPVEEEWEWTDYWTWVYSMGSKKMKDPLIDDAFNAISQAITAYSYYKDINLEEAKSNLRLDQFGSKRGYVAHAWLSSGGVIENEELILVPQEQDVFADDDDSDYVFELW